MGLWSWIRQRSGLMAPPRPRVTRRFAVDNFTAANLSLMRDAGAFAIGRNGVKWGQVEANAPVAGVHTYASYAGLLAEANACHANGMEYQLNLLPDMTQADPWGLGQHPTETYVDPTSGNTIPKWTGAAPGQLVNWIALITHLMTNVPVDILQIGSEAENAFADDATARPEFTELGAGGFAELVREARRAARAVRPTTKVITCGVTFENRFMSAPGPPFGAKQTWVDDLLVRLAGQVDAFSLHLNNLHAAIPATVAWVRERMTLAGYNVPIWADDMSSGFMYESDNTKAWYVDADWQFQLAVIHHLDGTIPNAAAIAEYARRQAQSAVIKPVTAFAAGVERVFLTSDTDFVAYFLYIFRVQGLIDSTGIRRAAYYSYKQLVSAIDGWIEVQTVGTNAYKFTLPSGARVVIAWADAAGTLDLSGSMPSTVKVQAFPTTLDGSNNPIYPTEQLNVSVRAIPVDTTPVLIRSQTIQDRRRSRREQSRKRDLFFQTPDESGLVLVRE